MVAHRTRKPQRTVISYTEIVKSIARERFLKGRSFTYGDIRHVLDLFIAEVKAYMIQEEEVYIPGFGRFFKVYKRERRLINPRTKLPMMISGTYEIRFRMGANLKHILGRKDYVGKSHEDVILAVQRKESTLQGKKEATKHRHLETDL